MKEGKEGKPVFAFLAEDLEALDKAIAGLSDRFRAEGQDMGASMEESSETYHDNAGFEIGWRQQNTVLLPRSDELRQIRANAKLVHPNASNERVSVGKTVTIRDLTTGKVATFTIGSYLVLSNKPDRVSYDAPLAKIIMNAEVGDEREGVIAGNPKTFEIVKIS